MYIYIYIYIYYVRVSISKGIDYIILLLYYIIHLHAQRNDKDI